MSDQIPDFLKAEAEKQRSQNRPAAADHSSTIEGVADHMNDFRAPDLDLGGDADDRPIDIDAEGNDLPDIDAPSAQLDREQFYAVFKTGFDVPAMFLGADFAPVSVQPSEVDMARAASDGLYTLLDAYYPAALSPMGDRAAAALALGMFALAKARLAQAIMAQRKVASQEAQDAAQHTPQAANDNYAPPDGAASPMNWLDAEAA